MYIKFCRSYGEDKKEESRENLSPGSKLSVELEGEKGSQTEGSTRLYRAACVILMLICLVLLLVVILLAVKLQAGSAVCSPGEEVAVERTCSPEQCRAHLPSFHSQHCNCHQCADGWLTFGQSCFYLSTTRLSWDESQKNCSNSGGSLAVISSQRVQRFLTKEGKLYYWIGLRQKSDGWTWINDSVLRESYWAGAGSSGDCGILSGEKPPEKNWVTASCQAYAYFICQLQLDTRPGTGR